MPNSAPRAIARGVNSAISCEAGTKGSNFSGLVSAIATSKPEARVLATVGPAAMLRRTDGRRNRRPAGGALLAPAAVPTCPAPALPLIPPDAGAAGRGGGAHLGPAGGGGLRPAPPDQRRPGPSGPQL